MAYRTSDKRFRVKKHRAASFYRGFFVSLWRNKKRWEAFITLKKNEGIDIMLVIVNNERAERAEWMLEGDMPVMANEAITFHEVLRAP
ncbi:MAG: hypothetical protein IJU81_03835 [Bacteroidales bacterium]|nr:hypothetical protein [Bacteroidales bacterium]